MRSVTRRCMFAVLVVFLSGGVVAGGFAQQAVDWGSRFASIEDPVLRRTMENSVATGLVKDVAEFEDALARADARFHGQNPTIFAASERAGSSVSQAIRQAIARAVAPLAGLDRDAVRVRKSEGKRGRLFEPYSGTFPPSYEAAYSLAQQFDPRVGTDETQKLARNIDTFLAKIANDPTIQHALKSTNTSMADLKRNWFGKGAGFEHVVGGEVKGSSVSGYHWWFRFFRDEQSGKAEYVSTAAFSGDNHAYTGAFTWDPDGPGPLPRARKKKGGFSVGNSVQVLLALGHIAIESARKHGSVPGALAFDANINGESFTWQLYTMDGTIRSLYPMGKSDTQTRDRLSIMREYYRLESEVFGNEVFGNYEEPSDANSPTVH